MKVFSFSRNQAQVVCPSIAKSHAIISIYDNDDSPAQFSHTCDGILYLPFLDLDYADIGMVSERYFYNGALASSVASFVTIHKTVESLVIHCNAGMSRSVGMANAIGSVLGVDVTHYNTMNCPNNLVYDLTFIALGGKRESAFGKVEI